MAKRYNLKQNDACREKIQTSQLINRLESHAHGKLELSATQLKAIEILLRKTLPDLSSVEMKHEGIAPFALIPERMEDVTAWQDQYGKTEH